MHLNCLPANVAFAPSFGQIDPVLTAALAAGATVVAINAQQSNSFTYLDIYLD
jgi:hypothetical protein